MREPPDTFLGVSKGGPGKGVGSKQAAQLLTALRSSKAAKSGLLADLAEAELFIRNIGRDKISDLTTNIIRPVLSRYTLQQCQLWGITAIERRASPAPLWHPIPRRWVSDYLDYPIVDGVPVLLVPKYFVRRELSLDSKDFYNEVVEFLQAEYNHPGSSLVTVLKSGDRVVYKKDVKEEHPFDKNFLFEFSKKHPKFFAEYKKRRGNRPILNLADFTSMFDDAAYADSLIAELRKIPTGDKSASAYHRFMTGVLTYLFHPGLVNPRVEQEIHERRKRIDILYTNSGVGLFFLRIANWSNTRSGYVPVECKNYGSEVGNPEFDQLTGRFSHDRGFIGILCCRSLAKRQTAIDRARDAVRDGRGYPLIFEDTDIEEMLGRVANRQRADLQHFLNERLDEIAIS